MKPTPYVRTGDQFVLTRDLKDDPRFRDEHFAPFTLPVGTVVTASRNPVVYYGGDVWSLEIVDPRMKNQVASLSFKDVEPYHPVARPSE